MLVKLFEPYMLFISFFLTIIVNIYLISKNVNWIIIVIGNLIVILVLEFLGLDEYNFLNKVVEWILDFIGDLLSWIWKSTVGGWLERLGRWLGFEPDRSYGGGGGGFRGR